MYCISGNVLDFSVVVLSLKFVSLGWDINLLVICIAAKQKTMSFNMSINKGAEVSHKNIFHKLPVQK